MNSGRDSEPSAVGLRKVDEAQIPLGGYVRSGDVITVTDGSGQTTNVLCGNIPTANATVFVIDKVVMTAKS